MKKYSIACFLFLLTLGLQNCKSTSKATTETKPAAPSKMEPYLPTEENAKASNHTLEELTKGREIYVSSCQKCHRLYPTNRHDYAGWVTTVTRMTPKAQLNEEQKKLVINYLSSGS